MDIAQLAKTAGAQFLDADPIRGSAKRVFMDLQWKIIDSLEDKGMVFIKDSHGNLDGALNQKAVKNAITDMLGEESANVAEYSASGDPDYLEYEAIFGTYVRAAKKARITIEKVVSPRTGISGWKLTSTDLKKAMETYKKEQKAYHRSRRANMKTALEQAWFKTAALNVSGLWAALRRAWDAVCVSKCAPIPVFRSASSTGARAPSSSTRFSE